MKNCAEIKELLSLHIDNNLESNQMSEVEQHLNSCENCRRDYNFLKIIVSTSNDIEELELPQDFNEKLHNKLIDASRENKKSFIINTKFIASIGSIAAVFIILLYSAFINNFSSSKQSIYSMTSNNMQSLDNGSPQLFAADIQASNYKAADMLPENKKTIQSNEAITGSGISENIAQNSIAPSIESVPSTNNGQTIDTNIEIMSDRENSQKALKSKADPDKNEVTTSNIDESRTMLKMDSIEPSSAVQQEIGNKEVYSRKKITAPEEVNSEFDNTSRIRALDSQYEGYDKVKSARNMGSRVNIFMKAAISILTVVVGIMLIFRRFKK